MSAGRRVVVIKLSDGRTRGPRMALTALAEKTADHSMEKKHMKRSMVWLVAGALGAPLASPGIVQAAEVATAESEEYGNYLADAEGMALYMFEADQQGSEGSPAVSNCSADCAAAWPPLIEEGDSPTAAGMAKPELLGTVTREDGSTQVTYNGWPLYTYIEDTEPGSTEGQDVEGFGAEWYLVAPEGEEVHGE